MKCEDSVKTLKGILFFQGACAIMITYNVEFSKHSHFIQ